MLQAVIDFFASNAALFVAALALVISLRANSAAREASRFAAQSKADADRLRQYEGHRALLNELDLQHTRMSTLMMLTAQKLILFKEHPRLHETETGEFDRLTGNLDFMKKQYAGYDAHRQVAENVREGSDAARTEDLLAEARRLTIHLEKDVRHEERGLLDLSARVRESGA